MTPGSIISYDFTNSSSKAFADNLFQINVSPAKYALFSGDVDHDGFVDVLDVITVNNDAQGFASGYNITDLNGDGITDSHDLVICYNNSLDFVQVKIPQ
jgi:hypothetical protein